MASQTLMLIGGPDAKNGDFSLLLRSAGKNHTWACPKQGQVGDEVLIYISAPVSKVIARARVVKEPRPGSEFNSVWDYVAIIGPLELLPSWISFKELRDLCPDWAWLRYPRKYAYVPDAEARILNRRARQVVGLPEETTASGAGFGDPETNRLVEVASVRAVTRELEKRGYVVRSREKEKLGYDLDATKGKKTLHVEVKGIAADFGSFPITAAEVKCAKTDSLFQLAITSNALNPSRRRVEIMKARQFLQRFALRELNFMAMPRKTR